MAEITCDGCGKKYNIDLSNVTDEKIKRTCISCGQEMVIHNGHRSKTSKNISLFKSIKFQINVLIVSIVVIVMAGYAGFSYYSSKAKMEKNLQYSAQNIAVRLSKDLNTAFWALDNDSLKAALASEMMNRQIYAINIIDKNGHSIYLGFKRDKNWQMVPNQEALTGNFTTRKMNIVHGNEKIGAVQVYLTDKFVKADLHQEMISIVIIVAILILSITLFISLVLQKVVIRPISNLANIADRISMGEMSIDIPVTSRNEIGLLAHSFDRLKTSLEIGMQALRANR